MAIDINSVLSVLSKKYKSNKKLGREGFALNRIDAPIENRDNKSGNLFALLDEGANSNGKLSSRFADFENGMMNIPDAPKDTGEDYVNSVMYGTNDKKSRFNPRMAQQLLQNITLNDEEQPKKSALNEKLGTLGVPELEDLNPTTDSRGQTDETPIKPTPTVRNEVLLLKDEEKKAKAEKLYEELMRRQGKDFSKTTVKNDNGTETVTKGKDYDKDHDLADPLRSAGLSALATANGGDSLGNTAGRALGGGIAGLIRGIFDRNADEKLGNQMKMEQLIPQVAATQKIEQDKRDSDLAAEYKKAQIDIAKQTPQIKQQEVDIKQQKVDTDKEYKQDVIDLGTKKANELKVYREAILELKQSGVDQADKRIKLLEDTLEERKRSNVEGEKDKDLDREARITVAKILNQGKVQVANINQQGALQRQQIAVKAAEQLQILKDAQIQERNAKTAEEKAKYQQVQIQAQKEYIRLRAQVDNEP